ncbi:hypothetical protein NECAME_14294 [Necator americanus]|uniref:Uncharacterized protein n=1 Tax=Necator americanus TaxID=51031 RepID=W2SNN6_NECAM|nr:hypothetical protein NECAME_14294 [Necator americanus]ETN71284.1 hypothetical protein NECAME_14294 [Necator americanus]
MDEEQYDRIRSAGGTVDEVDFLDTSLLVDVIYDALQACDYNGNSCVVVIRLLKPELSFRSSALPQPELSVPAAHTPMKVEESSVQEETTLQKIEQR